MPLITGRVGVPNLGLVLVLIHLTHALTPAQIDNVVGNQDGTKMFRAVCSTLVQNQSDIYSAKTGKYSILRNPGVILNPRQALYCGSRWGAWNDSAVRVNGTLRGCTYNFTRPTHV